MQLQCLRKAWTGLRCCTQERVACSFRYYHCSTHKVAMELHLRCLSKLAKLSTCAGRSIRSITVADACHDMGAGAAGSRGQRGLKNVHSASRELRLELRPYQRQSTAHSKLRYTYQSETVWQTKSKSCTIVFASTRSPLEDSGSLRSGESGRELRA